MPCRQHVSAPAWRMFFHILGSFVMSREKSAHCSSLYNYRNVPFFFFLCEDVLKLQERATLLIMCQSLNVVLNFNVFL